MIQQTLSLSFVRMAVPKVSDQGHGFTKWAETHNPYYFPALDHDGSKLYGKFVVADFGDGRARRS